VWGFKMVEPEGKSVVTHTDQRREVEKAHEARSSSKHVEVTWPKTCMRKKRLEFNLALQLFTSWQDRTCSQTMSFDRKYAINVAPCSQVTRSFKNAQLSPSSISGSHGLKLRRSAARELAKELSHTLNHVRYIITRMLL
jgi:hypothetical protein